MDETDDQCYTLVVLLPYMTSAKASGIYRAFLVDSFTSYLTLTISVFMSIKNREINCEFTIHPSVKSDFWYQPPE